MRHFMALVLAALVAVVGEARADTPETQKKHLDEYTPYLMAPVDEFRFWSLYKWQLVGPDKIVVWSTIKDAYLLTVEEPCTQLQWTKSIGVTSQASHKVLRRMDAVIAGNDRCRIVQIQPIDYARMQQGD
ncbi:DUF6491 family protein [Dokdonella sp.]|uniref:DUF6491 family protein n=1 Tax=Dokdonella sp. TaxID=2291710 RepID=UPI00261B78B7|nr:DUF6491 family protein [Dokdonella sp.]